MILVTSHPDNLPHLPVIQKVAMQVLKKYKPDLVEQSLNSEVSINFISDAEIQDLNNQYRNKDKPTDVLSWGFINSDLLPHELAGEIYVSTETALKDSSAKNITITEQYNFLIIHGLLHVFNYDHNTDAEELEMNSITEEILNQI
jgi:probable rRNA maturation factor